MNRIRKAGSRIDRNVGKTFPNWGSPSQQRLAKRCVGQLVEAGLDKVVQIVEILGFTCARGNKQEQEGFTMYAQPIFSESL